MKLFESPIDSEEEVVVIEEDSISEYLSSPPGADCEADNNTTNGNPSIDTNESNEGIAQNVTQFFNSYDFDQEKKWIKKAKDKFTHFY